MSSSANAWKRLRIPCILGGLFFLKIQFNYIGARYRGSPTMHLVTVPTILETLFERYPTNTEIVVLQCSHRASHHALEVHDAKSATIKGLPLGHSWSAAGARH